MKILCGPRKWLSDTGCFDLVVPMSVWTHHDSFSRGQENHDLHWNCSSIAWKGHLPLPLVFHKPEIFIWSWQLWKAGKFPLCQSKKAISLETSNILTLFPGTQILGYLHFPGTWTIFKDTHVGKCISQQLLYQCCVIAHSKTQLFMTISIHFSCS